MKTISFALFALIATSATALADDLPAGCNPSQGNWVNAAPTTCPTSDAGGDMWDAHHPDKEAVSETETATAS